MPAGGSNPTHGGQKVKQILSEQRDPLLRTKLFVPPIRAVRVARPGLIAQINNGLDKELILVSAPAGFGKTTLLAEWVAQAGLPVAWLSLDAGDNDPNRFLLYMIAALEVALADREVAICAMSQAMLQSGQPIPIHTILIAFINDLTDITAPFALVLDDYQFITDQAAHEALTFILERLPSHAHLVIASRVDPSIPLHRLRAAQRLLEIRTDRLRFTGDETESFLNKGMALSLSPGDISILVDRTEGWVVGLQMAALSMQRLSDRSAFVRAMSGSHRYILEYLLEEVLGQQPESLKRFLLQTSILDRLCAPLCNALLMDQEDSQAIIERLDRSNLFLSSLDEVGYWYRYHHLFADLLRAQLLRFHPESLQTLHLRASRWYEQAHLPEEAIQHALAAQDLGRVARLVEHSAFDMMRRGELTSLLRLFEALPRDLVISRPALGVYHAWALTFAGQINKVEPIIQEVEKQVQPDEKTREVREILGSIAIIRGLVADFQGNMPAALEFAHRADELLPEDNLAERTIIPYVLGDGYSAAGELDKAELAFEKIMKMGQTSGNLWTASVARHKLALLKKVQGELRTVNRLYQEAIQFASERGGQHYGSMGATYVGLSDLLREGNELDAARQMASQAIQDMERWQSPTDLVNGYVTLARIALSQGDTESSETALVKAEEIGRQGKIFPITWVTLEAGQVLLWLVQGDHAAISRWMEEKQFDEKGYIPERPLNQVNELEWMTLARVLIAQDELDLALNLLTILAEAAEAAGRHGRLIEILVLLALALDVSGKRESAIDALAKSLTLAEPEGYMRIFLDEGKPMAELLQAFGRNAKGSLKAYTGKLLKVILLSPIEKTVISPSPGQPLSLIETLTEREKEVLHLLAAGLSNQEIAERLYLSEGTIKTHTHNLYGKLGVQSRTRAIARAKELHLI